MLTVAKIAAGAPSGMGGMTRHMLTQTVPKEVADLGRYYTRENEIGQDHARLRQDMHPIVAKGLGVDPQKPVSMDQINALLAGRRADGQKIEGKTYSELREYTDKKTGEQKTMVPIGSVDFCLTPDKSVSVAWAFGVPAEQAAIFQAHADAAGKAMAYVEMEMAKAAKGKGGQDGWDQGHIGWVYFDHYTSRPTVDIETEVDGKRVTELVIVPVSGDMDLHRHHTVTNAVFCENGRVGSMDLDRLDGFIKEAGALYQAHLAQNLRNIGAEVIIDQDTGSARLPAIPDEIRTHYSKRTTKGEDAAREYAAKNGLDWDGLSDSRRAALLKKAVQSVPKGLDEDTIAKLKKDDMADFASWKQQAADLKWHHETIIRKPEGPEIMGPHPQMTPQQRYEIAHPAANHWLEKDGVNQRAVISEGQVRTAAARSLIVSGISDYRDISGVVNEMMTKGITQYGEKTSLISGQESDKRRLSYTTALHERDENEFISKARRASEDMSKALEPERLKAAIERSGLKFEDDHGKAQLKAIHQIGEGGALTVMIGAAGAGKAQPVDAEVLTPTGFKRIGDLRVGDIVTTPDGHHVPVTGVFPQGVRETFKVLFEDGRTVECCEDHLWKVWAGTSTYVIGSGAKAPKKRGWGWRVRPLKEIKGWFDSNRCRVSRTAVPLVSPCALELPSQDLPIPPYVLGALLGDGHFSSSVRFTTADSDILDRVMSFLPRYEAVPVAGYDFRLTLKDRSGIVTGSNRLCADQTMLDFEQVGGRKERILTINGENKTLSSWAKRYGLPRVLVSDRIRRQGWTPESALGISPPPKRSKMFSPLSCGLRDLGLADTRSESKFVPQIYKQGSVSQRLAVLQGLLDTDGSVEGKRGTYATFTSTSEQLAKDVQWLAWSLGAVAKLSPRQTYCQYKGQKVAGKPSYRVSIVYPRIAEFFSLPRKVEKCIQTETRTAQRLCISKVEPADAKEMVCISVDHPEHLYVTNDFVVTHNTTLLQPLVDAWQEEGRRVYGMALAWRQADDLIDAGIKRNDTKGVDDSKAISVFLSEVSKGKIELDSKSVIVVDELSLLGTRQGLDLLRLREKHDSQLVMIGDDKQCQAQPLDAKVLTPNGFVKMGSLKSGDTVTCPDGTHALIVGVVPQGEKEVFRVTFRDGRSTECCADHLWKVWKQQPVYSRGSHATRKMISHGNWVVIPFSEIKEWFDKGFSRTRHAAVPLVSPFAIDAPENEVPIPPYALGLLLGDGHFAKMTHYCTSDQHLIDTLASLLPDYEAVQYSKYNYRLRMADLPSHRRERLRRKSSISMKDTERSVRRRELIFERNGKSQTIRAWASEYGKDRYKVRERVTRQGWTIGEALDLDVRENKRLFVYSPLSKAIFDLGLKGTRSDDKFIPEIYKSGSAAQRLDMLRGLLDTDGTVGEGGTYAVYYTTSYQLAMDVQDLAWSLGATTNVGTRDPVLNGKKALRQYYVGIRHPDIRQFFGLPRKRDKAKQCTKNLRLRIESIEQIGLKETQCIVIDHPEHLYVTDNYIVTHNSISAGPIIDLSRKALGPEKIPEILTTIRQETERERDIAGLFRAGDAGIALAMKREDKTVELAPGSYAKVAERVAELMAERVRENGHDKRYSITVSAPTNADAHNLSVAIRDTRRAMGLIGKDLVTIKAAGGDNDKVGYDMKIAAGDKVRLFKNISAQGQRGGSLGRNGSVVTVVRADKDGVVLQPAKGKKEGYVPWEKLVQNGKIRLAYGDVMTTHTAQGSTATEHIYAMPGGTKAVNGFSSYSSGTRHRQTSYMVISERAERAEVKERRPVNDPRPIKSDDLWGNAARNLGYQPVKSTATDFIKRASGIERGSAGALQRGLLPGEVRERQGLAPTTIHTRNHQRQTVHDIGMVTLGLEAQSKNLSQTADTLSQALPRIGPAVEAGVQRIVRETMDGASPQATGPDRGQKHFRAVVENIPREHIDALKRSVSITHLIGQSVKLDAHGKGLCPFHNEKTPSFHVNEKKGTFKCFGCGESGDTVSWLTEGRGMPFHQALDYLSGKSGIELPAPRIAADKPGHKTAEWSAVLPVPDKAPPLIKNGAWTAEVFNPRAAERGQEKTAKAYKPDHVASYKDAGGNQIGYVLRMEMSDGSKYTPQIAWAVPSNAPAGSDPVKVGRWALVTMGDAKPLYRAEELARHPDKTVILVMGEKKADDLQKIVGNGAVVVSWAGGDNGRHTTDFSPLRGRNVIIWPDADIGGKAAAIGERTNAGEIRKGVAEYAGEAGAAGIKVIVPPDGVPKGWDAGDMIKSGADRAQIKAFISEKAADAESAKKVLEPQIVEANAKAQEVLKANAEIRKAEAQKKQTVTKAPDAAPAPDGRGKAPVNKADIQPRKGRIRGPSRKH